MGLSIHWGTPKSSFLMFFFPHYKATILGYHLWKAPVGLWHFIHFRAPAPYHPGRLDLLEAGSNTSPSPPGVRPNSASPVTISLATEVLCICI